MKGKPRETRGKSAKKKSGREIIDHDKIYTAAFTFNLGSLMEGSSLVLMATGHPITFTEIY